MAYSFLWVTQIISAGNHQAVTNEVRELKQEGVTKTNLVSSVDWVVREGLSEEGAIVQRPE